MTATSKISISQGMKFIAVDNPTPFITGMRVRAMAGTSTSSTKFVEGTVGTISDCSFSLLVDNNKGNGSIKNARFSVAGLTGARGPRGFRGAIGPRGERGETGAQGLQGALGLTGATETFSTK